LKEKVLVKATTRVSPVIWAQSGILALLLIGIYFSTYRWLIGQDWSREDFSYSFLIPFIVLYLLWDRRKWFRAAGTAPSWVGSLPFLAGIVLFWLGELGGEFFSLYLSSWLMVVGLIWMLKGWPGVRSIWFALFMLLAMFPLPHFLYNQVSVQLKLISSRLGVAMIQMVGMPAYREGNVIDLGFTQLQVVDACSGLRYLIPLVILSLLMAYFYRTVWWKRAVVVASSVPLSIVTNGLRIALTGILYSVWGAKVAEDFFHGFSGWFIFMFSLVVLLLEIGLLRLLPPDRAGRKGAAGTAPPDAPEATDPNRPARKGPAAVLSPVQFPVAAVLMGLTLVLSQGVEFREKIPISQPLSRFPLSIGEWTGAPQTMEQEILDTLDLSDYAIIDYQNRQGRQVNFYTAYYESQRKGESIHSPATCLPGSGWVFKEAGVKTISSPETGLKPVRVNRAFMQKGESKQVAYYWFLMRGRALTNTYQLKFFVFWDALTHQRTDGTLVRLITPVYENENEQQAETRLRDFASETLPILDRFIPGPDAAPKP
jgi:exosortase D (VPLPA-CTERM-specific)